MDYHLTRFLTAQNSESFESNITQYELAIEEIKSGRKESHWIWFVFPQIKSLGTSYESDFYGLSGLDEAKEYLNHPVLSERLISCFQLLLNSEKDIYSTFKYDEKKVFACATLFYLASNDKSGVFYRLLELKFDNKQHEKTVALLNK